MTRWIAWPLVLTCVAALTLLFSASPARAATNCSYAAPVVTVTLDPYASVTLSRSGDAIQFNLANCGAATVLNTDKIVVTGSAGSETLTIDLGGGPFAPGASPEATGASEIEFELDLGTQPAGSRDHVLIRGTAGPDTLRLGSAGVNLNNDTDADLTGPGGGVIPTTGTEYFTVLGLDGNDLLAGDQAVANGGSPVPGPVALELSGGDGLDTLRGGSYDDLLDGGLGADFIKGNAGVDTSTYLKRTTRVLVDIAGALDGADANNDGIAEEGDTTTGDVENLIGGKATDLLIGSDAANVLTGNDGADELRGLGAIDALDGGAGADKLVGGLRNDSEHGGPGNDTFDQGAGTASDGADDLFGETGVDTVDYSKRKMDLAIRLDGVANDGADTNLDGSGLEEGDNVRAGIERVLAGQGNDILVGSDLADQLLGGNGADLLDGGLGADLLDGQTGVDTATYASRTAGVVVTLDNATNDGTDADADGIAEEQDNVGKSVENLRGGHGRDHLYGSTFPNVLEGGDDVDVLDGFGGPDVIFGGPGLADAVLYESSLRVPRTTSVWVTLDGVANDGTDLTLNGTSEEGDNVHSDVEIVDGSDAADLLVGDSDSNALYGEGGDDTLDGQGGPDDMIGMDGNDWLFGREGADYLGGTEGNDDFFEDGAPNGADEMWGGNGRDTVHYSSRSWPVAIRIDDAANDGDFATSEGDNVHSDVEDAVGGSGPDAFQGSSADNHFTGGAGNDGMHGNDGNDFIHGGADNDTLYGDNGDDALIGGFGNDDEHGDAGRDYMLEDSGPNGADTFADTDYNATVDYSSRTVALVVDMDGRADDGADLNGDGFADEGDNVDPSIGVIDAGSGNDTILGRPANSVPAGVVGPILNGNIGTDYLYSGYGSRASHMNGGAGDDTLEGSPNIDYLDGGTGDDLELGHADWDYFLEGSEPNGADEIYGGSFDPFTENNGIDTIDYSARPATQPVRVDLDDTADDGGNGGAEGDNAHSDVERIRGSNGNDVLIGNNAHNEIYGYGGDDQIDGGPEYDILYGDFGDYPTPRPGGGNDTVDGGEGDDIIYGENGADTLFGGIGDDEIIGGPDNDTMDGGAGSDIFHALDFVVDTVDGGPDSDGGEFDANDVLVNFP